MSKARETNVDATNVLVTTHAYKAKYDIASFWRDGWTRLSCKFEANREQGRQDRIDHRARLANAQVRMLLQGHAIAAGRGLEEVPTHRGLPVGKGSLEDQCATLRGALANVRLLAARHRKEAWAQQVLRLCREAGVYADPLRRPGEERHVE